MKRNSLAAQAVDVLVTLFKAVKGLLIGGSNGTKIKKAKVKRQRMGSRKQTRPKGFNLPYKTGGKEVD